MWNKETLAQRTREAGIISLRDVQRAASCAGSWQSLHPLVTAEQPWEQPWLTNAELRKVTLHRLGARMFQQPHPAASAAHAETTCSGITLRPA